MEDSLEEVHEELLSWAEDLGVRLQGIRPMRLSGRGFGGTCAGHSASCKTFKVLQPGFLDGIIGHWRMSHPGSTTLGLQEMFSY